MNKHRYSKVSKDTLEIHGWPYEVVFSIERAEPDVGIPRDYIEIWGYTFLGPMGNNPCLDGSPCDILCDMLTEEYLGGE